ncbi:hypothetical protein BWR15_30880 [Pseudomonas sp. T]|nr:hypothetical protein BWR15_30880 [Pseudomonas sp. T]
MVFGTIACSKFFKLAFEAVNRTYLNLCSFEKFLFPFSKFTYLFPKLFQEALAYRNFLQVP